ncbi:MAG TPA: L-serine ammonia-lyase, iron-sulfur-dependent, subunit alpha [Tissierellaceae bacterium]|nr:L-serine ammonia-lyase, iron-sulfur-dependent, subunit alpha [Tissierellaceae bacterium]
MITMEKVRTDYSKRFLQTLINGVKPALGCTEPVAVGLATAKAYEGVKGDVKNIHVKVSPNVFKNGMGVGIPGTKEIGLVFASALGVTCGDASLGLEVFSPVNDEAINEADRLLKEEIVKVELEDRKGNFYIEANIETNNGKGICIIKSNHTNIVYVEANGEVLFEKDEVNSSDSNSNEYLKNITIQDIREFVETVDFSDIEFLLEGVKLNIDIAEVGLEQKSGPGIGAAMDLLISEGVMQKDIISEARMLASAACDARMAGVNMPVMSSGGSGNQGITAIIPPALVCDHIGCDDDKLARTLAFSHLVVAYTKVYLGGLSPVCGCAVSAGIGATSSIVWTLGGTNEQIGGAIKNIVGTLTGMVCDGAKGGCAFKISTATSEAIIQAQLAMENVVIDDNDGIVHPKAEETIRNLASFCNKGMKNADNEIIRIMTK